MELHYDIVELVLRVKRKDQLAMKLLYEKSAKAMFSLSLRITNNVEDSKDVIQEAYLVSFNKINTLSEPKKYYGWLKQIVVNASIKVAKSKMYYHELDDSVMIEESFHTPKGNISSKVLDEAIKALPNGCREVLTLYLLEGYKHKEVADFLEIKVSTSKSQYSYALKLLRQNLEKYDK